MRPQTVELFLRNGIRDIYREHTAIGETLGSFHKLVVLEGVRIFDACNVPSPSQILKSISDSVKLSAYLCIQTRSVMYA